MIPIVLIMSGQLSDTFCVFNLGILDRQKEGHPEWFLKEDKSNI